MTAKTISGQTLDWLGEGIVAGRFAPGSSVPPEPQLCEQLSVSRTVVREAVKSLVAKGLLVTGPKVGTRVLNAEMWNWFDPDVVRWQTKAGLTVGFLREVQELRRLIEPAAVALAAQRATPADLADIEKAFVGMSDAVKQGGDYVTHDLAFHQGLLRASHNRLMSQMSRTLGALLRTSFEISTSRPFGPASSLGMHRDILDAVKAGAAERAERASVKLIDSARDDVEAVLAGRRQLPLLAASVKPLPGRTKGAKQGVSR
jgi:DNA-binding FadR family transcriptional regulator